MEEHLVFEDYLTPLGTVPSWEFNEYKEILEETVEDRLDDIPEHTVSLGSESYGLGSFERHNRDLHGVERRVYNELLQDLEDIESKQELMEYTREQVETSESSLPVPFNFMQEALDTMIEGPRAEAFERIYREATEEFI